MTDTPAAKTPQVELENHQKDRFNRRVEDIADGLRRLADRIQREAGCVPRVGGRQDLQQTAHDVLHELHWGIANLNSEALVMIANDYTKIISTSAEEVQQLRDQLATAQDERARVRAEYDAAMTRAQQPYPYPRTPRS